MYWCAAASACAADHRLCKRDMLLRRRRLALLPLLCQLLLAAPLNRKLVKSQRAPAAVRGRVRGGRQFASTAAAATAAAARRSSGGAAAGTGCCCAVPGR